MRKQIFRLVILTSILLLLFPSYQALENGSNINRGLAAGPNSDFYIVYTDNYDDGTGASLFITSQNNTYGTVSIPGIGWSQNFTVFADTITTIDIPLEAEVQGSGLIENKGIHITSVDEITAYFLNPGQPVYTNDAYVALPVEMLGTEHIVLAWPDTLMIRNISGGYSELAIVSPFDANEIQITPSISTGLISAGETYTVTLDQYQTYTLQSDQGGEDLSGTIIRSSAPIALFAGNRCADIPVGYSYCDHVVEQLPPTNAWGDHFSLLPMASRVNGDLVRILASENGTTLTLTGSIIQNVPDVPPLSVQKSNDSPTHQTNPALPTDKVETLATPQAATEVQVSLDRGQIYETWMTGPTEISSDQPILVGQYATGSTYGGQYGDPLMMLVVPNEQFLDKYTFLTPTGYPVNYINIIIPNSATGAVVLDGYSVNPASFSEIGSSGYSGTAIPVYQGSHTVSADQEFGLYVYGFGTDVSYGYPGGFNSKVINPPPPDPDRLPIILIPGLGGTRIVNDEGEIWINIQKMIDDAKANLGRPTSDLLDVTRLNISGTLPLDPNDPHYASVKSGTVITKINQTLQIFDFPIFGDITYDVEYDAYQSLISYLESQGYLLGEDLFLFPYDWRRDLSETAADLDLLIDSVRGEGQVNIIAHSMGGLVTRNYILDPSRASKVENAAILGTPFLGVPYAFKGLYFGDDFGINDMLRDKNIPYVNLINEEKIKEVVANWPGIYELLPGARYFDLYEGGYIQEDYDLDNDHIAGGVLDYTETEDFVKRLLNPTLVDKGNDFHTNAFDGFDQANSSVNICLFAGVGFPTEERIRFWQEETWFGFRTVDHASFWWGNGDTTVLRHSIDLKDGDTNYRGDAKVFYAKVSHGDLPKNRDVLQQVSRCFAENYTPVNNNIRTDVGDWTVSGYWTEVNSPVELHVYDDLGNHLGPTELGTIEYGIPNAKYIIAGHDKTAFVPKGINYHIELVGLDSGEFDLKVRNVFSDTIQETALYKNVPVVPNQVATLPVSETIGLPMSIDTDGDGVFEATIDPDAVLDPVDSQDVTPPKTEIFLAGTKDKNGWYTGTVTVTLKAEDNLDGSGVSLTEYSLDSGFTVMQYVKPFEIDVDDVPFIYAKSIDLAGNEEYPLAFLRVQPFKLYLPMTIHMSTGD